METYYKHKDHQLPIVEVERAFQEKFFREATGELDSIIEKYDLLVDLKRADGERVRILGAELFNGYYSGGEIPENIDEKLEVQNA